MTVLEQLTSFFQQDFPLYPPFHPELLQFCEELSSILFKESHRQPDITALAFWLRRANLHRMHQFFLEKKSPRAPLGTVFHIPPANIDVMLIYSWISSLLVGNANIVRIPSTVNLEMTSLENLLEKYPSIKKMNAFIRYGHEQEITAWISRQADARIIWGGDNTVEKIRAFPLQPHAVDIAFPDRFSFAALHAKTYRQSNKEEIAAAFYSDMFPFDQSACSSPRLIFWVGENEETPQIFYEKLQDTLNERRHKISTGGVLLKKTYLFSQALALPVEKVLQSSNELSVMFLKEATPMCRVHCGQGLLYHVPIQNLEEMIPFVTHRDQTLTYYGFSPEDLQKLSLKLNGKGITRMVPFGQALHFEPVWDGIDLFSELTQEEPLS